MGAFKITGGASISTFSIIPNIAPEEKYMRGPIVEALRSTIHKIKRAQRSSDILPFLTVKSALLMENAD